MRVLILLACVAFALAEHQDHHDCGPLQRLKVKQDWHQVFSVGLEREELGREFWRKFFFLAPEARALFDGVNGHNIYSAEFTAHSERLLGGLDMSISLLDQPDVLAAELAHLKTQHDPRNIQDAYWGAFKKALSYVIPHHLDHNFDQDAWESCAEVIAQGIRGDH